MFHDDSSNQMFQRVLQALRAAPPSRSSLSDEQLQTCAARITQTWLQASEQPDVGAIQELGADLANLGLPIRSLTRAKRAIKAASTEQQDGNSADDSDAGWEYFDALMDGYITSTKRAAQQTTITEMQATQQREDQLRAVIQELSTPIIPIYRGVLVLPLVGAIDSLRSQEITERLLEEIVRQQADMVIIDITGVTVVDTSVANHLIMTAQAVTLLGSKVVFTGISSTIAQTIIQLGVNLGDVVTLSNLQAGMLHALEQLGLGITELSTV